MTAPLLISYADQAWAEIRATTFPRQHAYARRHGYQWRGYCYRRTDRPASWNKVLLLLECLAEAEEVWWIDADAAPAAPETPLPAFCADVMLASDHNGHNCGVMGVRSSDRVRDFLEQVWAQDDCTHHPWWEQAAVQRLLPGSALEIGELPKRYNALPGEMPDPVIVHCAARPWHERLAVLRSLPAAEPLDPGLIPAPPGDPGCWPGLVAIDTAHGALIYGLVAAHKPARVLELGIGTGYTTDLLLRAMAFNGRGELTCVDNWLDWGGAIPAHANALASLGAEVITAAENDFLRECQAAKYDFLVSDADHSSGDFAAQMRVLGPGGIAVFHDTAATYDCPALARVTAGAAELPHYHFRRNSRPDERCDRGLLVVTKP